MKEFIEKLIERLEERITENCGCEDDEFFDGQSNAFLWTIEIINQLAEKYKEQLPKQWKKQTMNRFERVE